MNGFQNTLLVLAALALVSSATQPCFAGSESASLQVDSAAAFELLTQLHGDWQGTVETKQGAAANVVYRLTANRKTVMETLFPGTDDEMISMYHMDGNDLVMTHYCAMGNQPRMKLASAKGGQLVFDFAGGSNLDAKKDVHIHSGTITFINSNELEAEWKVFQGEKPIGANRFFLTRLKN